jgi:hypothetical protein
MKNNLFKVLNWILKSENEKPELPLYIGYLCNRWLSMASKPIAQIINITFNRWNTSDTQYYATSLRCLLPKYKKHINYIKKSIQNESETDNDSIENFSQVMELSVREIEMYHKTLAELGIKSN